MSLWDKIVEKKWIAIAVAGAAAATIGVYMYCIHYRRVYKQYEQ